MSNVIELQRQAALARTEIKNLRQQISALKHEHLKEISVLKLMLERFSVNGSIESAVPARTPPPTPSASPSHVTYHPIGHLETGFRSKRAVPRQASVAGECRGTLVLHADVYNNPEHALSGLTEFSHMWIVFHMHAAEGGGAAVVRPPRLRGARRGVLATRSPHRPCPVGLSLVRILHVDGNRIEFSGVDMLNGTVVLDIKPYIPQYDYPAGLRPPTQGDDEESTVDDSGSPGDASRLSPCLTRPVRIDTGSPPASRSSNLSDDGLESPAASDRGSSLETPLSPSPESPAGADLDARSPRRPPTERGAPDGQERFTPPQSNGIRVPSWVTNAPSLEVRFADDALVRLNELIGERADLFKANLESLLAEDPRSQYVRSRYPNHEYSCVLEDLSISCVFDDAASTCTVVAIRSAEEMQQT